MSKKEADIPETGPEAIAYALSQVDLKELAEQAKKDIRSGKKTKQNRAVALLNIIQGMERNKQTPEDFLITKVPVIPAKYRPFAAQGGTFIPGDANILYKDLFDVKQAHEEEASMFGKENAGQSRLALYNAVKALYGYGDPVNPKTNAKEVGGFLKKLTGTTAKYSFVNSKMMAKTQDNVGRSTIIVDPELDIDEIGIPKGMAFKMYAPYVQRELKMAGYGDVDALQSVKDQNEPALKALEKAAEARPVIFSRAPAWHGFSVLGGKVKLTDGKAISINPYVTTGLNADFDGDQQVNTVFLKIFLSQDVIKSLTDDPTLWYSMPMFKDISIHTAENGAYQGTVHLEAFPHGEFSNRVEGKNGPIDFYHVPEGVMVLAHDKETNSLVWKQVKYWSVHHDREVEIVNLDYDMQIVTDDDPRAVYGIAKDSADLEVRRFTPTEALAHGVCVPFVKDASSICKESFKSVTIPGVGAFPLTFATGELLGMLCGDGWWHKRDYTSTGFFKTRAVCLADSEGFDAAMVGSTLESVFGPVKQYVSSHLKENDSNRFGDCTVYHYTFQNSTEFTQWLTSVLGGEKTETSAGAATKHLPAFYVNAPVEFREGLLCGLIDTDGTICTSNAKGKPQLMISFTSTSIRMCQEVKLLCSSLGIQSKISFSKTTAAGNASYIVTISAADAKRSGVFGRMCHVRKRDIFCATHVSEERCHDKKNKVPFPECVSKTIRKWMFSPKVTEAALAGLPKEEADWRVRCATVYQSVVAGCNAGIVSRGVVQDFMDLFVTMYERRKASRTACIELLRKSDGSYTEEDNKVVRAAFYAIAPKEGDAVLYKEADKYMHRCAAPLRAGTISARIRTSLLEWLETHEASRGCLDDPVVLEWKRRFADPDSLSWAGVVSVEKTGHRETGYDLTVPGHETFTSADGIVLSNTINVHVPSTDAAVKEVREKFMPSATPFSNREARKVVPNLKQEQILGLYTAATAPKKDPVVFGTEEEAINAIRRGEVPLDADVEVNGKDYSQYGQQKEASAMTRDELKEDLMTEEPSDLMGKEEKKLREEAEHDKMTVEHLLAGMSDEDKHLLGADFEPKLERLRKALEADDGSVVFSTDADGKTRAFRWDDGDTMEMAYVRPEDRGKGFGRKLVHQSTATKTKVKRKNEAMKHILGARWKFDDLNGDHEDWVRKERTDAEVEAERKFNEVLDTFKGMGLKPGRKLQLVYTDSPDVYEDGSPVLDPELVNATEVVDSSTSGGSQTKHGKIYINSDMGRVMEHHGVKDMSPADFTYHMMGHELAHEFDANVITEEQREKLLKAMEDEGYHSRYADSYDKEKSPHKWKKEAVAEYLSHLNATRRKETGEEKQAALMRAALEEAGVDPTEDTVMFANMINKASGFRLVKTAAGGKDKKFVMLKGCKQENGEDGPCVKSTHFSAYLPDKDVAEAAIRVAKSGKKEWLCRLVSKYCGVRRTCGEDWKIVDFKSMEE